MMIYNYYISATYGNNMRRLIDLNTKGMKFPHRAKVLYQPTSLCYLCSKLSGSMKVQIL
jgi:hypothetical protein